MNTAKNLLFFVCAGACLAAGIKAAEWIIPAPPTEVQVMVCRAGEDGAIDICRKIEKL